MHADMTQLAVSALAIALLILLITKLRLHPFLALMLSAGFLGVASGLAPTATVKTFEKGFGGVLSTVGLVIGLGSMRKYNLTYKEFRRGDEAAGLKEGSRSALLADPLA